MRVLVTGGSGFVGRNLIPYLRARNYEVIAPNRMELGGRIDRDTFWSKWLSPTPQAVVHLANRAHVMRDESADPISLYRHVNVDGTLGLARAAREAGVRRFVYLSSVKAMGEERNSPYRETDTPRPADPYGISKLEAEGGLLELAANHPEFEVVILRPPLVYGRGVKANFAQLIRWVRKGVPLPFGAIENSRSLIFVGNLASAIETSLAFPGKMGGVFLVRDGTDVSTAQLIRTIAREAGVSSRQLSVPAPLLKLALTLLGKADQAQRLMGSLTLDDSSFRKLTRWNPPFSLEEGLRETLDQ